MIFDSRGQFHPGADVYAHGPRLGNGGGHVIRIQPTGQYEQVGLAWYYDDSHMVKLGREIVDGPVCVVMGREERDQCRTIARPPVPGGWYRLRLIVSGNQIRGQYWPEGASGWTDAGSCDLPVPPNGKAKISLHSYNGPADQEHWARITDFSIVRRTR